ncbi:MAG: hypothetical protein ACRC92_15665 [Peptostreptococcaceae bacterium]
MSAFLAPIHTWLFNKIKLAQDLEENIVNLHVEKFGEEANVIKDEAEKKYGEYLPSETLENLIDVSNIHGWLQERIKEVESRSAFIISRYYDMYKDESKELTKRSYINQAKLCASNKSNKVNSPENVYISLNNYILSGMPCDRANSVIDKNEEYIVYEQNGCIHKVNYELGKGNLLYLYELRNLWVKTFVENLYTKYLYEVLKNGDVTTNKIIKG